MIDRSIFRRNRQPFVVRVKCRHQVAIGEASVAYSEASREPRFDTNFIISQAVYRDT